MGPCRAERERMPWLSLASATKLRHFPGYFRTSAWLVIGTSLDQVTQTTGQVAATVTFGSAAVLLLIGLGVFVLVRRGLRPIEAMASHADRITGGDLTGRVATHDNTRSEVGRQSAARGTLGVQGATGHWAFRVLRAVLR
jgi:HAMP domain-containing protein